MCSHKCALGIVLFLVGAGAAGVAHGSFTPIDRCWEEPDLIGDWNLIPPDEPGNEGILGYLYGWGNVTRVEDAGAAVTDQRWRRSDPNGAHACVRAIYAVNAFDLGWLEGGGAFHEVLHEVAGYCYLDIPSDLFFPDDPFRFGIHNYVWTDYTSLEADNGGEDHMVTFRISGNADQYGRDYSGNAIGDYVICWEDLPFAMGGEREYNDLVVQVHGVAPSPAGVVPEPTTALLLAPGLVLLFARGCGKRGQPGTTMLATPGVEPSRPRRSQ